jgi:hypothetical protein
MIASLSDSRADGPGMSTQQSGIRLTAKTNPLLFLARLFPVIIEINGQKQKGKWGEQFLDLGPGSYTVAVSWKLYWVLPVGKGFAQVNVQPGTELQYKTGWAWFLPGKLVVASAAAVAA